MATVTRVTSRQHLLVMTQASTEAGIQGCSDAGEQLSLCLRCSDTLYSQG